MAATPRRASARPVRLRHVGRPASPGVHETPPWGRGVANSPRVRGLSRCRQRATIPVVRSGEDRVGSKPDAAHEFIGDVPARLWAVPYVGARFPDSCAVAEQPGVTAGAHCQLFAYEVLDYFGLAAPALRSNDLWADTQATVRVARARPLDLVLVNATSEAWGAHVGVWVGDEQVLHLSAEIGRPAVWRMSEFAARTRYRVLIGFKRVARRRVSRRAARWSDQQHEQETCRRIPDSAISLQRSALLAPEAVGCRTHQARATVSNASIRHHPGRPPKSPSMPPHDTVRHRAGPAPPSRAKATPPRLTAPTRPPQSGSAT